MEIVALVRVKRLVAVDLFVFALLHSMTFTSAGKGERVDAVGDPVSWMIRLTLLAFCSV